MERKADKKGVAIIEMTFLAPSELPQESTQSKILVDGKELPDFAENRQDYQITYKGQRPKVSVEETNQVASTVVDSGDDSPSSTCSPCFRKWKTSQGIPCPVD